MPGNSPKFLMSPTGDWGPVRVLEDTERSNLVRVVRFTSPATPPRTHKVRADRAIEWSPARNTRLYFEDLDGRWAVGTFQWAEENGLVLKIPGGRNVFLAAKRVFARDIAAPTSPVENLAYGFHESPRFHRDRHKLVRSLVQQRATCAGLTGLISSSVNIYPHQVEVVRRVLQDPVPRYLLADEVGLGKTIEAGTVVRQFLLDCQRGSRSGKAVVVVPPALLEQWRSELKSRFGLTPSDDGPLRLLSYLESTGAESWTDIGLLVIDEAHRVAVPDPAPGSLEAGLRAAAVSSPGLLLLSATPALHSEGRFLAMLHMLDPTVYRPAQLQEFRAKVRARAKLAELYAGLQPSTDSGTVEEFTEQLQRLFPGDTELRDLVEDLRPHLDWLVEEGDSNRTAAIRRVRQHVSETYRLHRRVLRTRRETADGFVTRGRSGLTLIEYDSSEELYLGEMIESWASLAALSPFGEGLLRDLFPKILSGLLGGAGALERSLARSLTGWTADETLRDPLTRAWEAAKETSRACPRESAFIAWLRSASTELSRLVVFAEDSEHALDSALQIDWHIYRLPEPSNTSGIAVVLAEFEADQHPSVLICDARHEEGLNLQFADAVVHLSLPLSPNRVEQRIGRLDRLGAGAPVPSVAFLPSTPDGPCLTRVWVHTLDRVFRVFGESVSGLHYYIVDLLPKLLEAMAQGDLGGLLERAGQLRLDVDEERGAIARQSALDAIDGTTRSTRKIAAAIHALDEGHGQARDDVERWLVNTLNVRRIGGHDAHSVLRYVFEEKNCLVARTDAEAFLAGSLEPSDHWQKTLETKPLTFSRASAQADVDAGLVRLGSSFADGLDRYLRWDDRGTSYAFVRFRRALAKREHPEAAFRVEFLVEGDCQYWTGGDERIATSRLSVRRKMDEFFPPLLKAIWVDVSGQQILDSFLLGILEEPYERWRINHTRVELDFDLNNLNPVSRRESSRVRKGTRNSYNPERSRRLAAIRQGLRNSGPVADVYLSTSWPEICSAIVEAAEAALRKEVELADLCEERACSAEETASLTRQQLAMRQLSASASEHPAITEAIQSHAQLHEAITRGIREPRVVVDAVGAVFLTANNPYGP